MTRCGQPPPAATADWSRMLHAALGYAHRGLPVFPCHHPISDRHGGALVCSCGNRGCSRPGKHPLTRHGLHDATTDSQVIRGWWRRWPDASIAVSTGVAFDVLDLDSPAGVEAIRKLVAGHGLSLSGPVVRTGSGGWHYLLAPIGEGNRVGLLEGVDWRGMGGYVIAPPSRHISATRYRWVRGLDDTALPATPQPLRDLLARPGPARHPAPVRPVAVGDGYGRAALAAELDLFGQAPVGQRNYWLNRRVFRCYQLAADGLLDPDQVTARFSDTAHAIGLGEPETRRTLASARRAGLANPRTMRADTPTGRSRSRGTRGDQPPERCDGRSR